MRSISHVLTLAVVLLVGACNDKPNANFAQAMRDREAKSADDPYGQLDAYPSRPYLYARTEADRRDAYVHGVAGNSIAKYRMMLHRLDRDPAIERTNALFHLCRPLFNQVAAFEKNRTLGADDAGKAGQTLAGKLDHCRDETLSLGGDEKAKAMAALLRRFASMGITLTGIATVAHGDADIGMQIWQAGFKHVSQDRPGFHFSIKSFGAD